MAHVLFLNEQSQIEKVSTNERPLEKISGIFIAKFYLFYLTLSHRAALQNRIDFNRFFGFLYILGWSSTK
jgi:hypothetical protein